MTANSFNPTAANILSSLGVRGASVTGGSAQAGKIPILGDDGLLDLSTIPIDEITASLDIDALSNTAYVDPRAGEGLVGYSGTGSIVKPFTSLDEAAAYNVDDKTYANFILVADASAKYGASNPNFATTEPIIRIFSTGTAQFTSLSLYWKTAGTTFIFGNISVDSYLQFRTKSLSYVRLTGYGSIGTLQGAYDANYGTKYTEVLTDPGISITTQENLKSFGYLASSTRIANGGSAVSGETVADVTDSLGKRRIRASTFTKDATGIHAATAEDITVTTDSAKGYDVYDLSSVSTTLATAANGTFYKKDDSPTFNVVTAEEVSAEQVMATEEVLTPKLNLGGVRLFVDSDNFLTLDLEGGSMTRYQKRGDDEYFKSHIESGVQHYVKQVMAYDSEIGWGATWVGDYILVDGEFVSTESSDASSESDASDSSGTASSPS